MEEKYQNMIIDLLVAAVILFLIVLPRFCFKVDEDEYQRVKKAYDEKMKEKQMEELEKILKSKKID
jgi:large-conductance mechanosensitive channel